MAASDCHAPKLLMVSCAKTSNDEVLKIHRIQLCAFVANDLVTMYQEEEFTINYII